MQLMSLKMKDLFFIVEDFFFAVEDYAKGLCFVTCEKDDCGCFCSLNSMNMNHELIRNFECF